MNSFFNPSLVKLAANFLWIFGAGTERPKGGLLVIRTSFQPGLGYVSCSNALLHSMYTFRGAYMMSKWLSDGELHSPNSFARCKEACIDVS